MLLNDSLGKFVVAGALLSLISGCMGGEGAGFARSNYYQIGTATEINLGMQALDKTEMIKNLTRLFARQATPTINFDFNKADLDDASRAALDSQAEFIKHTKLIKFRVYGHTDKVGSNAYNLRLGKRRADAAVNYLVSIGVPRDRIDAVASYGETRPLVLTEGRSRENRRTVTEVVGFVPKYDGTMDARYLRNVYNNYVIHFPLATEPLGESTLISGTQ